MNRLTKRARQALDAAQDEARRLGHASVTPAHLVLGLIPDQATIAGDVLRTVGVQLAPARSAVAALYQPVVGPPLPDDLALNASAHQVLVDAHSEADVRAHHFVGTEHVLLGIVHRTNDGSTLLDGLGAPPEAIRRAVLRKMGVDPPALLAPV